MNNKSQPNKAKYQIIAMVYAPPLFLAKGVWLIGVPFLCVFIAMFFLNKSFISCRNGIKYFSEFTMGFTLFSSILAMFASLSVAEGFTDIISENVQLVGGIFIIVFGLIVGNLFFFNKMDSILEKNV